MISVPVILVIMAIAIHLYTQEINSSIDVVKAREINVVSLSKETIAGELESVVSDLKILSQNAHLLMYLENKSETMRHDLETDFLQVSIWKTLYDQIRYIDETGMETVRINYDSGTPSVVPPSLLQNKKNRYYFKDAITIKKEAVYISPFDLNIENGEIEYPLKPMIRLSTPVFDVNERCRGIVVVNYFGRKLLDKVSGLDRKTTGNVMLVNSDGFWLKGLNSEDEWGFMFEDRHDRKFGNQFSEAWNVIASSESGQFFSNGNLFTYTTMYPVNPSFRSGSGSGKAYEPSRYPVSGENYYWKVVSLIPSDGFAKDKTALISMLLALTIPVVILISIGAWLIAISKVRRKLAEAALQESHNELERRVEIRTEELRVANRLLTNQNTELEQAREILRKSEHYYRSLINHIHEDIIVLSEDYKITDMNETFVKHSGKSREELLGVSCHELLHSSARPCHLDGVPCSVMEVFEQGVPSGCVHMHPGENGENIWFDNVYSPMKDDEGRVTHVIKAMRDITPLKKAEEAFRESEKKYRLLVDNADDAIFVLQGGFIRFSNPKTGNLTGFSPGELLTMTFDELIDHEDRVNVMENGSVKQYYPFRIRGSEDERIWVEMNYVPVEWEGEKATLNFLRDISSQKILEEQLRQAQKMEAIGTLAGGIAHDFNNILFPIMGYTEIALDDLEEGTSMHDNLTKILAGVKRARDLVMQILTFSRQTEHKVIPLKIHLVVKEALKLLKSTIPSTIKIRQNIDSSCGSVIADPTQIHQIIMNLCTNAYHAMGDAGGTLEVSLRNVSLQPGDIIDSEIKEGEYLRLSVSDTGPGIDKAILNRIFDPYFTTKEKGKGTGLGLSVVHGIVKTYDGRISVYSEPGEGTVFNVYFRRTDERGMSTEITEEEAVPTSVCSEHILLVDDEAIIIEMAKQMLEKLGYRVTPFTDSNEALNVFEMNPDRFDLIVTDYTMPGMTGKELAEKISGIRPGFPIIMLTGFSGKIDETMALSLGIKAYIMKPVVRGELARAIRKALDDIERKAGDRAQSYDYSI